MKKTTYYIWSLALLGLIIACIAYPQAPEQFAIHWNIHGDVDGYAPSVLLFLFPMLVPLLDLFILTCRRLDPKRKNYAKFETTYQIIRILMASFTFLLLVSQIIEIYYPKVVDMRVLSLCSIGILISTFGNYMPKTKQNYFVGFRTPWALMNDVVWIKTHRVAGRTWFFGGFLFFVMAFAPKGIFDVFPYLITILIIVYPAVYSYVTYRKIKNEEN